MSIIVNPMYATDGDTAFADRLLAWYDQHGRHDLPWKQRRDPYCIWVSEIMLQQTQVATVLPYYQRFMSAFPDVKALAAADLDNVLSHWAGLGYYARARNLHRAARRVVEHYDGVFPDTHDALTQLPGIGRSTAAAILALAHGSRHAILDGNVRRVLARLRRIDGDPGTTATQNQLWTLAEQHTPHHRVDDYTQAIMDLGATLCTRSRPKCPICPVSALCEAYKQGDVSNYPARRQKRERPRRDQRFLLLIDTRGRMLLERRPPAGIWGGLWCLPHCEQVPLEWIRRQLAAEARLVREYPPFMHKFTHFDLEIRTTGAMLETQGARALRDLESLRWHTRDEHAALGMPAPIRKFIDSLDLTEDPVGQPTET